LIRERLALESDKGVQMAYASALGNLHDREAASLILNLLEQTTNDKARLELALALARLVGHEHSFIQLVRGGRKDFGTTVAQELTQFKRKLERNGKANGEMAELTACINRFARHERQEGITHLVELLRALPTEHLNPTSQQILAACTAALANAGDQHLEYLYLALHILHADW
jgi:HEAT repeat protein